MNGGWLAELHGDGVRALRAYAARGDAKKDAPTSPTASSSGAPLPLGELRRCIEELRERRQNEPRTPSARHLLRRGARLEVRPRAPEEEMSEERRAYLAKRRTRLLRHEEEVQYGRLVRNVQKKTASVELQRNLTSVKQHLSIGANMIVARVTAFVVIYMVSRPLTDNETTRVILGFGGAIGMMFLEMVLFITRAAKYDAIEQRQQRTGERVF